MQYIKVTTHRQQANSNISPPLDKQKSQSNKIYLIEMKSNDTKNKIKTK